MKMHLVLGGSLALFLSGCAQNSTTSENTEPPVVKGAEAAAKFAVGRVTGPPVRVAMAANTVVHKVEDKIEGKPTPSPTP